MFVPHLLTYLMTTRTKLIALLFSFMLTIGLHQAGVVAQTLPAAATDVCPAKIGTALPAVKLKTAEGKEADLMQLTKDKPTVLVLYRGGWCPFCTRHLAELGKVADSIKARGYQIVGITGDAPDKVAATMLKYETSYTVLSDTEGLLAKALGVAFQVPKHYTKTVQQASNGANETWLTVPAVFVLDAKATVTYSYVNPDFKTRLKAKVLLAMLEASK